MHDFASLDGQIKHVREVQLNAVSNYAFYGRSVFTTLAVYHSEIFQWRKHWRRLTESAELLGINLSTFSESKVEKAIQELIAVNEIQNGRIRATVFDESSGGLWKFDDRNKTSLLIVSAELQNLEKNLRLTVSPFPVSSKSPLAKTKSGNYLENILALENARQNGFDEAVRFNEKGKTVAAATANIFWVNREKIYTAPLETGALRGTTRDWVLESFPVGEEKISPAELKAADEIFLTSAGIGIAKVESLDEKKFNKFTVSTRIQKLFDEVVRKKI